MQAYAPPANTPTFAAMFKLWSSIKKDWRILTRDRVGLAVMFLMPIVLAIVIAMVQNSTFELVNDKKVPLLVLNQDSGEVSRVLENTLDKAGVFILKKLPQGSKDSSLKAKMQDKEALLGMVIPPNYSKDVLLKAENVSARALQTISVDGSLAGHDKSQVTTSPITLYYHPVLQKSFRQGIDGALNNVLQIVQSKYIVRQLYSGINDSALIPEDLEKQILSNETPINQLPVTKGGSTAVPNATQHNIPAWTVFAMFFIVISLGSSIVREKTSGSFLRLKTMPTSLSVSIMSKQITYVIITIVQAIVIFGIGKWVFPKLGLPGLDLPSDKIALLATILICGWCATSFAICVGIFSKTPEQSNGIGAIAIVLFAAIGGLLVPSFAMPESFKTIMLISPLHWCLESFYGLFLEGGRFKDLLSSLMPIFIMILILQVAAWIGMKRQQLV